MAVEAGAKNASAAGGAQQGSPANAPVPNKSVVSEFSEDQFLRRHREDLERQRRDLGEFHHSVSETLNLLGLHHHHVTDDQAEALRMHSEALKVLRRCIAATDAELETAALGVSPATTASSPSVVAGELRTMLLIEAAISLTDIGNVNKTMGDIEEAMRSYSESLDVFRSLGMKDDHPRVAATLRCVERIDKVWVGGGRSRGRWGMSDDHDGDGGGDNNEDEDDRVDNDDSSPSKDRNKDGESKDDGNSNPLRRFKGRCGSTKFHSYLPSSPWGGSNN